MSSIDIIESRYQYVYSSANLCNKSLTEIFYLSRTMSQEEVALINGPPFQFYRVSLQYCFNSEYNKLLENRRKISSQTNHISSIYYLNNSVLKIEGEKFNEVYQKNQSILQLVEHSTFRKKQLALRDKKFSHSDFHEINNPFRIEGLATDEIGEVFEHLKIIYTVLNNCASFFDREYDCKVSYNDDRTSNFIKCVSVYKKYYHSHFFDAHKEGFGLF